MPEAKIHLIVNEEEIKVEVVERGKRIDISPLILLRGMNMKLEPVECVLLMDCTMKMYTKGGNK